MLWLRVAPLLAARCQTVQFGGVCIKAVMQATETRIEILPVLTMYILILGCLYDWSLVKSEERRFTVGCTATADTACQKC